MRETEFYDLDDDADYAAHSVYQGLAIVSSSDVSNRNDEIDGGGAQLMYLKDNVQVSENDMNLCTIRCTSRRHSVQVFTNYVSRPGVCFDNFTYIFALGASARACLLLEGKQIHCRVIKHGVCSDVMVQTTAMQFYAKTEDIGSARKVFDEMSVRSRENWNAMIAGYCSQRERVGGAALSLFRDMLGGGVKPDETTMVSALSAVSQLNVLESRICLHGYIEKMLCDPENDVYVGTGLVDMYSKCGCVDSAMWIFERMREKNVLTWTTMTSGLAIHVRGKEALEVLDMMEGHRIVPQCSDFP